MKMSAHELMVRFVYDVLGEEIKGEWVNVLVAYRSWLTPNNTYKKNIKRVEFERVDAVYGKDNANGTTDRFGGESSGP